MSTAEMLARLVPLGTASRNSNLTDHELTALLKQLTGPNSTGKVSYCTKGGFNQLAGVPTIICGPGHIAQAHQPDELVAQSELDSCDPFVRRLAGRLEA
jgi:acetylornithine deacetylase